MQNFAGGDVMGYIISLLLMGISFIAGLVFMPHFWLSLFCGAGLFITVLLLAHIDRLSTKADVTKNELVFFGSAIFSIWTIFVYEIVVLILWNLESGIGPENIL